MASEEHLLRLSSDGSTIVHLENETITMYDIASATHSKPHLLHKASLISQTGNFFAIYFENKIHSLDIHGKLLNSLLVEERILSLQARPDFLLVTTETSFLVLTLPALKRVALLDRPGPPLCAVSLSADLVICAFSGLQRGTVRVQRLKGDGSEISSFVAHNSELKLMAVAPNGALVATLSEKSTVVRIFSVFEENAKIAELRRIRAEPVTSLVFSPGAVYLGIVESSVAQIFRIPPSRESKYQKVLEKVFLPNSCLCFLQGRPLQVVFGKKPLTLLALLANSTLLIFRLDPTLSEDPVLTGYKRLFSADTSLETAESGGDWTLVEDQLVQTAVEKATAHIEW